MSSAADPDADIRARIQQHWEASERGDIDAAAEHAVEVYQRTQMEVGA